MPLFFPLLKQFLKNNLSFYGFGNTFLQIILYYIKTPVNFALPKKQQ